MRGQDLDEVCRGELAALIRAQESGASRQRLLHSFYAKIGFQCDRHPLCQNALREPVQYGAQIDERCVCRSAKSGKRTTAAETDWRFGTA